MAANSREPRTGLRWIDALASRGLAVLCLVLAGSATTHASDTPYRLYPALDATALSVSALVWWGPSLFPASFVAANGCACRTASLNSFDRWAAGKYRSGFSATGEIMIASVYSLVVLLDVLDVVKAEEPAASFLTDIAVLAETLFVNGALNQLAKIAVRRPRPLLYGRSPNDPRQSDPDSYVSFYSAHTSSAFAIGLAYAQTFAYRHPDSPYRWLVYAAALATGSGIGLTRIAAGKHFPSDVLVGAGAGAALGLVIPWLHRRSPRARLSVTATPDSLGLALAIPTL